MKKVLSILMVAGVAAQASAQIEINNNTRDRINAMTTGSINSDYSNYWGPPTEMATVVGEVHLDTTWTRGYVKLAQAIPSVGGTPQDSLGGLSMRYNVYSNEVEVLLDTYKDVKAIPGSRIKYFALQKNGQPIRLVNTQNYPADKAIKGFYEVLAEGKLMLLQNYRVRVQKPTYNAAVGVGEKDHRFSVETDWYVARDGKAEKWNPSKKAVLQLMKDREKEVSDYLKTRQPDFKNQDDLVQLFKFYNDKI